MPTDDERREVAARLRENAESNPHMGLLLNVAFADCSLRPEGAFEWEVSPHDAALRLADLIEPEERTCRVVTEMRALSQTQDKHTKSCSSCGYVFGSEEHRQLLPGLGERVAINPVSIPKFCPNCGAKVVEG